MDGWYALASLAADILATAALGYVSRHLSITITNTRTGRPDKALGFVLGMALFLLGLGAIWL